jgi:deoxyribose-phosphate aldolase
MLNKYQEFIKESVKKEDTNVNSKYNSMIDFTYLNDDATLEKIREILQ